VKSGHSIEWNNFGIAETADVGRSWPKLIIKRRGDRNSCIVAGIILCIINDTLMQQGA
jgi:uncharacterized membrane protein YobD (UPF0266 family)